jgi:hypothetical protein
MRAVVLQKLSMKLPAETDHLCLKKILITIRIKAIKNTRIEIRFIPCIMDTYRELGALGSFFPMYR